MFWFAPLQRKRTRSPSLMLGLLLVAAIFAGDIAGYSRLMGVDEEGTLRQLKAHRKDLVDPKITEHRGRIVKTTGDGILEKTYVLGSRRIVCAE